VIAYGAATTAVWIVYDYSRQCLTVGAMPVGRLLLVRMAVLLIQAVPYASPCSWPW